MSNYTRFSCPNLECKFFNQTAQGNITHRSWGGKDKMTERLRCTCCKKEFSSNQGTLREQAKISENQQVLILKCCRWGVPETGIADIAEVSRKTVRLFQEKASIHAEAHHVIKMWLMSKIEQCNVMKCMEKNKEGVIGLEYQSELLAY